MPEMPNETTWVMPDGTGELMSAEELEWIAENAEKVWGGYIRRMAAEVLRLREIPRFIPPPTFVEPHERVRRAVDKHQKACVDVLERMAKGRHGEVAAALREAAACIRDHTAGEFFRDS